MAGFQRTSLQTSTLRLILFRTSVRQDLFTCVVAGGWTKLNVVPVPAPEVGLLRQNRVVIGRAIPCYRWMYSKKDWAGTAF